MTNALGVYEKHQLRPGIAAVSDGMLWIENTRTLIAADVHLAYEEVIGGALPLWSTEPAVATVSDAARALQAHEIVLLGDIIHGATLSLGARRRVSGALRRLRTFAQLELIAGNHEGRSRGAAVLGETHEALERDGWLLLHGDRPSLASRAIIGHLHPSLHLGGNESAPVFLVSKQLIVMPALTPYSTGLDVRSEDCLEALAIWNVRPKDVDVVASGKTNFVALGTLAGLRSEGNGERRAPRQTFRRKFLRPDR